MTIPTTLEAPTALAVTTTPTVLSAAAGRSPLKLHYAARWRLWIKPTGAALTTVRYRRRGRADWPWDEWVTATGVAPADGAVGTIELDGDCAYELDLEITGAGGCNVALYLVGV